MSVISSSKIALFVQGVLILILIKETTAAPFQLNSTGLQTWQSTSFKSKGVTYSSDKAIDGCYSTDFYGDQCCSCTKKGSNWWSVDLGKEYQIDSVILKSSEFSCCALKEFYIYGSMTAHDPDEADDKTLCLYEKDTLELSATVRCTSVINARYVMIVMKHDYLVLCEVGFLVEGVPKPLDLTGKPTWQSSDDVLDGVTLDSSKAIDGCNSTLKTDYCCAQTIQTDKSYWSVDLGSEVTLHSVLLTNMKGYYYSSLRIYGSLKAHNPCDASDKVQCYFTPDLIAGETASLQCYSTIQARYLIIERSYTALTLCEVGVNIAA